MVKSTAKKETEKKVDYTVEVIRAKEVKLGTIAFDVNVNGVTIYGCFYKAGISKKTNKDYELISFPQRKGTDDKYYNIAWFPISADVKAEIIKQLGDLV